MAECKDNRFVITSLPRCGSTSLARIVNLHSEIRCLIEPFHPHRYNGVYHKIAAQNDSVRPAVSFIWRAFNSIKHVWEANGWPFVKNPFLNCEIVSEPEIKVVMLLRRNYFRRLISNLICRRTGYWIGTKEEFDVRVRAVQFTAIDPTILRDAIDRDVEAISNYILYMDTHKVKYYSLFYEDLFDQELTMAERHQMALDLLKFLEFGGMTIKEFERTWMQNYDVSIHRWSSEELYRRIPNIYELESQVGCDKTGWLFKP